MMGALDSCIGHIRNGHPDIAEEAAAELAQLRAENERMIRLADCVPDMKFARRFEELRAELDAKDKALEEARKVISDTLPRVHGSAKNDEFCRDVREWLSLQENKTGYGDMPTTSDGSTNKWTCDFCNNDNSVLLMFCVTCGKHRDATQHKAGDE